MKRVLIISPHFPPVNAPDMQRARQCLPHLAAHGWEAEVLAVDPMDVAAARDDLLASTLPPSVPIHRVRAPRAAWARAFGLTSLGRRATRALGPAGDQLLNSRRFDLVFFSTTQFHTLTLGPHWSAKHAVPYVVDWQDPWVTDFYDRPGAPAPPGGWKYRLAARAARRLEGRCLESAAGIVSVNPKYLRQLAARYSWMSAIPSVVIPFGAEPSDFTIALNSDIPPAFDRKPGVRHFVYVGAAGPIMRPALEFLFRGINAFLAASGRRDSIRFHFIGTSYAPEGSQEPSVRPLAAAAGLADLVDEQTARIGHFAALRALAEADAVLLLGSADPGYSPSKIATLALAGRPVLALVPRGAELAKFLAELGFAHLAAFGPGADTAPVVDFLRAPPPLFCSPLVRDSLSAQSRTRELLSFFGQVVRARAPA